MKENATPTFGDRVRAAREAAGLSGEGLAFKAQVTLRTVERIETGEVATPHRATALAIASALGLTLDDLRGIPATTAKAAS